MTSTTRAVKNVGAIWLNLLVHAIVGFLLSPFILHRLGDQLFSLWVLVFTVTGYCGLLDLGIRSAVVRYVAKFASLDDHDSLARFVNTSLAFYCGAGVLSLVLTAFAYFYFPFFFKLPATDMPAARLLLLMAGTGVALSFPLTVFVGVLEGMQQFACLGLTQMGFTLLRGVLIVIALSCGGRLLAIGGITVGINLLVYVIFMCVARRTVPIALSIRQVDGKSFRPMISYGAFAFVILIADKLRFQSDVTVIAALLSTSAITSFTIGAKLVEYSTYAVRSMAQIFTPVSSHLYATGDVAELHRTLLAGSRACALIVFPLCAVLITFGKPILELWVGAKYLSSYPILVILVVPRTLYLAQSTSTKILMGMGKHRLLAVALFLEGLVNVALSIALARSLGIIGVAAGTAIPLLATTLFFLPRHICHNLGIELRAFTKQAYLIPITVCAPFACTLWVLRHGFPVHRYSTLLLQLTCAGIVYCAALACAFAYDGRRKNRFRQYVWRAEV